MRAPGAADRNTLNCSGPSGNTSSMKVMNTFRNVSPAPRKTSIVSGLKSSPTINVKIYDNFLVKYFAYNLPIAAFLLDIGAVVR